MPGSWRKQDGLLSPVVLLSLSCCHRTLDGHTWVPTNPCRLSPCTAPRPWVSASSFTSHSDVWSFFPNHGNWAERLSLGVLAAAATPRVSQHSHTVTCKLGVPVQSSHPWCFFVHTVSEILDEIFHTKTLSSFYWPIQQDWTCTWLRSNVPTPCLTSSSSSSSAVLSFQKTHPLDGSADKANRGRIFKVQGKMKAIYKNKVKCQSKHNS